MAVDELEVVKKAVDTLVTKHWKVTPDQAKTLLDSSNKERRLGQLLTVHKHLRLLYPENPEILYGWVKMKNKKLDNQTALDVMLRNENGVETVIRLLAQQLSH